MRWPRPKRNQPKPVRAWPRRAHGLDLCMHTCGCGLARAHGPHKWNTMRSIILNIVVFHHSSQASLVLLCAIKWWHTILDEINNREEMLVRWSSLHSDLAKIRWSKISMLCRISGTFNANQMVNSFQRSNRSYMTFWNFFQHDLIF